MRTKIILIITFIWTSIVMIALFFCVKYSVQDNLARFIIFGTHFSIMTVFLFKKDIIYNYLEKLLK